MKYYTYFFKTRKSFLHLLKTYMEIIIIFDQQNIEMTPIMTSSELYENHLTIITSNTLVGALIEYRRLVNLKSQCEPSKGQINLVSQ